MTKKKNAPQARNKTARNVNSGCKQLAPLHHKEKSRPKGFDSDTEECAAKYLVSLSNPFDPTLQPCIPGGFGPPSLKLHTFTRGTCATGTNGIGYVLVSATASQTINCVFYTGSGATVSTAALFPSSGTGLGTATVNSLFGTLDFGNDAELLKARLVSLGVRLTYSGTTLNMGGTYYALETRDHASLFTMTANDVMASPMTRVLPIDRKPINLCYTPTDQDEMNYVGSSQPVSLNPFLCIVFANPVPGATFQFEVAGNYEVIGKQATGATRNPVGSSDLTSRMVGYFSQLPSIVSNNLPAIEIGLSALNLTGGRMPNSLASALNLVKKLKN